MFGFEPTEISKMKAESKFVSTAGFLQAGAAIARHLATEDIG
jgi:hypothetical protein